MSAGDHQSFNEYQGANGMPEEGGRLTFEFGRARDAIVGEVDRFREWTYTRAGEVAERQKAGIAAAINDVSENIRTAAGDLREHPNLAVIVEDVADAIEHSADTIMTRPVSEFVDRAEDVCRRHPMAVAAGSAVAGALIAHLIKDVGRHG